MATIALFTSAIAFSQIDDERDRMMFQTVLMPVYDTLGNVTFIKPSVVKQYKHPTRGTKIVVFNYLMDTIGYYKGVKLKFVKLPKPR